MKMQWAKYLIVLAITLVIGSASAYGQGRIYTRKARLADFPTKTTKVVLSGDSLLDLSLREEVRRRWRISPFEFCDPEDFESLKNESSYYFLYLSQDGSGISYLSLMKGGNNDSFQSLDAKLDVVSVPFAPEQITTGREFVYLPALIDIVQVFVEESIMSSAKSILGLSFYNGNLSKMKKRKIFIARDDLSAKVAGRDSIETAGLGTMVVDDYKADSLFVAGDPESLIAFSVCPSEPSKKAKCYNFIVSADSHDLYYYQYHRYRKPEDRGFTPSELKSIRKEHMYKDEKRKK